jgi:hypothetical protein
VAAARFAARERTLAPFVATAFLAARERSAAPRRRDARFACRASDARDVAACRSRPRARIGPPISSSTSDPTVSV